MRKRFVVCDLKVGRYSISVVCAFIFNVISYDNVMTNVF